MSNLLRLLMTTQVIDSDHPILGFSTTWARKIAERVDKLHIVCLSSEKYNLPNNVSVHSLGKEKGASKLRKFLSFQKYVGPLLLRKEVDGVFVQQTEINAILAAPYAKIRNIPLVLFKAHSKSLKTSLRLANLLIDAAITSAPGAYPIDTHKKIVVGQGIDIEKFKLRQRVHAGQGTRRIIAIGRYAPIKGYEVLVETCNILRLRGERRCSFTIYGADNYRGYREYREKLNQMIRLYKLDDVFELKGPVPYSDIANIYDQAFLIVQPTDTDSLDKVVLEAMASERLALTSISSYRSVLGEHAEKLVFNSSSAEDLADKIAWALSLSYTEYESMGQALRSIVVQGHSADHLADQIVDLFTNLAQRRES